MLNKNLKLILLALLLIVFFLQVDSAKAYLYETSFETGDGYSVRDRFDYDAPGKWITDGHFQIVNSSTNVITIYDFDGVTPIHNRTIEGRVHGGNQAVNYPFMTDKWYHFEAMYKYGVTNGEYHLWIDGEEIIAITGIDTTPRNTYSGQPVSLDYRPAGFEVGITSLMTDPSEDYVGWIDNIIAANYRVG